MDDVSQATDVAERALRRSREVIELRRKLINARGYHAIFVGDAIHACEQSIVRYADILESHLIRKESRNA